MTTIDEAAIARIAELESKLADSNSKIEYYQSLVVEYRMLVQTLRGVI